MRWFAVWVTCVVSVGCNFGVKECRENADCEPEGYCHVGFCVLKPDSGVTTGGGGGSTGGGGGSTGGGTGGGSASQVFCAPSVEAACDAWQECAADFDGGSCQSQGFRIEWLSPAAQSAHRTATVNGAVRVTKLDGGVVTLTEIPVSGASGGRFLGGNGSFTGVLDLSSPDGDKTFVAGWQPPGPREERTIVLDTAAPAVLVEVLDRPTSLGDPDPSAPASWKKDEWALVKVTVDGGLAPGAANIVTDWDGGVVASAMGCGVCSGSCGCFAVDLAGSNLSRLRGLVPVRVEGISDDATNVAEGVATSVAVTRMKWARTLPGTANRLAPVAVARDGRVIAALDESSVTTNPARVSAYAQDGGLLWSNTSLLGTITAGPMVSGTDVWVGTNSGVNSQLVPFDLTTGASGGAQCIALTATVGSFAGDLALATTDAGVSMPMGVRGGDLQGPVTTACRVHSLASPTPVDPASRPSLATLTRGGSLEAFVAYEGDSRLWKASLTSTVWADRGSATLPGGTQPRGLFLDGSGFAGGGGVAGNGALFATNAAGNLTGNITSSLTAANASAPVVGDGFVVYGSTNGELVRASYLSGVFGSATPVALSAGNLQGSLPLLGERGLVYVVSSSGTLLVRRASDLSELWFGSVAMLTGSDNVSQLALDAYRGSAGARDCAKPLGVLYVTTRVGGVATLHAILVDSRGLDPTAPWPKYQRDNANTGNGTSDLSPWTCPP